MTRAEYLAREQEAAELRAQAIQAYRDSLTADCVHGRRRAIHGHGQDMQAGYECSAGKCGFRAIGLLQLAREWKAADSTPGVQGNPAANPVELLAYPLTGPEVGPVRG